MARVSRPVACITLLLLAFADLAWFGQTIYPLADRATLFPKTPTLTALQNDPAFQAHQARFLAPDSARVWQRFSSHRAYRQDAPDYQRLWADTLTPNLSMPYGLPDAYGYEPVPRRDTQEVVGTVNAAFRPNAPSEERAHAAAWAGILGVRAVVTNRMRPPKDSLPGLAPLLADDTLPFTNAGAERGRTSLSRDTRWQPRARLVTDFVTAASPEEGLRMVTGALDLRRPLALNRIAVIVGPVPFAPATAPLSAATITEDTPDLVVVTTDATRPALLVLADTDHPGWRATVDGRPAPLLSADGCLRAVALPQPGPHQVAFIYRPVTFLLGLYLTLLTLAGLTVAGMFGATRKIMQEKSPRPAKEPS